MERKIGILRGINVGGKRKILMSDLRTLCEGLGFKNTKTYIQSGNLIFDSNQDNTELEHSLEVAILKEYGFGVPVIIRTRKELISSIDNDPYSERYDISQLHLTFLKQKPEEKNIEHIKGQNHKPDDFKILNKDVFIHCEGKYHKSKLSNAFFEKHLNVVATTRNWKTVLKLLELSEKP